MPLTQRVFKPKTTSKSKFHIDESQVAFQLSQDLAARIAGKLGEFNGSLVLLCIGTDRSTGDCLGPLVGTKLSQLEQGLFHVYGTLDEPVHAANLREKLETIKERHNNTHIIAIDACLGNLDSVGCISVEDGPLRPGAGVNKDLPPVGDINIAGIVNVGGFMEYMVLQNTRLNLVMKMADTIAKGLVQTAWELMKKQAPCL